MWRRRAAAADPPRRDSQASPSRWYSCCAAAPDGAERQLVSSYVRAWAAGDYHQMYSLLTPASQQGISEARFTAAYRRDATTATTVKLTPVRIGKRRGEFIPVQMVVATRLFGTLRETLEVPLDGSGSSATVHYVPSLLFPGLARTRAAHPAHGTRPPRHAVRRRRNAAGRGPRPHLTDP